MGRLIYTVLAVGLTVHGVLRPLMMPDGHGELFSLGHAYGAAWVAAMFKAGQLWEEHYKGKPLGTQRKIHTTFRAVTRRGDK